jgi:hypothetical protein
MFTLVSVIGLAIRVPLLALLEAPVERIFARLPVRWLLFTPNFYADNLVLAATIIVVLFWNFFANRHWTYNDVG